MVNGQWSMVNGQWSIEEGPLYRQWKKDCSKVKEGNGKEISFKIQLDNFFHQEN
jgi:L-rhamnose mutarotase